MAGDSAQVKRTTEIEEATNLYFIHPISRALVTVFAKLGIHPNLVSVVGIVFGALAALAYYNFQRLEMTILGFALMIGWHIMDGADGQLARLTGKTSEVGKALDGLVDHLSFALVYIGLALASAEVYGNKVWWLVVAAGLSHIVQASTYEFQRQSYDYWVQRKESSRPAMPGAYKATLQSKSGLSRFFGHVLLVYLNIQYRVAGVNHGLIAQQEAMKLAGEGDRVAREYRQVNLSAVRTWSLLCSNYRTIAIFVACLARNPLYFFFFEAVVLNVVLVLLRIMQSKRNQELLAALTNGSNSSRSKTLATA